MGKKFFLSIFGYIVANMIVAVPWHMVLFHKKYLDMGAFTRDEPIMWFGMFAMLLQGTVFAYFYPIYYRHMGGGNPFIRGIQFCLFLGLTVWSVMVFATAAKFKIEPVIDFVLLSTAFQFIAYCVVGLTFGLIHRNTEPN